MRSKLHKYLLHVCFMLLLVCMQGYAKAANEMRPGIDKTQWQRLSNNKAFGYKNEREYVPRKMPEIKRMTSFWDKVIRFFSEGGGQMLLWIILFSIVGYVLYYVVLSKDKSFMFGRSSKMVQSNEAPIENMEDIGGTDWERLMYDATKKGDYRAAIRYSYIKLLQLLQERGNINYRIDKTNYDYYHELDNSPYKQAFKQLSRQYEYVWYGHFAIASNSFDQYMSEYNQLKKQLS